MRLPNGFGSIAKLNGNRRKPFQARITTGWTDEGKQIIKSLGTYKTKKEALQALSEYNAKPYDLDGKTLTFADVYNMWAEKELKGAGKSKQGSYRAAFKNAVSIHNKTITDLRTCDFQRVLDNSSCRSHSSLTNLLVIMHGTCNYALQNDYILKDYSAFAKISDYSEKKEKNIYTDDEISLLWKNSSEYYCKFALILIYTGLRISELLQMQTSNVHIAEKYMQGGLKTKAGKNRTIPLHNAIIPIAEEFYNSGGSYLIGTGSKPVSYSSASKALSDQLTLLCINHTPHETRHTTASLLSRYGANPTTIKKILGHSSGDITEDVYTHKNIAELVETINLIPSYK